MRNNMRNNGSNSITFGGLLALIFIVLKLVGVISWSWVWVLAPIWISLIIWIALVIAAIWFTSN